MSDTPRTDAEMKRIISEFDEVEDLGDVYYAMDQLGIHARELERELAAAKAEVAALKADVVAERGYRAAAEEIANRRGEMVDALIAERDEATKAERERCLRIVNSVTNDNPMTSADCADLIKSGKNCW